MPEFANEYHVTKEDLKGFKAANHHVVLRHGARSQSDYHGGRGLMELACRGEAKGYRRMVPIETRHFIELPSFITAYDDPNSSRPLMAYDAFAMVQAYQDICHRWATVPAFLRAGDSISLRWSRSTHSPAMREAFVTMDTVDLAVQRNGKRYDLRLTEQVVVDHRVRLVKTDDERCGLEGQHWTPADLARRAETLMPI